MDNTTTPVLNTEMFFSTFEMAQAMVGAERAVPMLVGPITLARLSKLTDISVADFVAKLIPVYQTLLAKLSSMKVRLRILLDGTSY